MISAYSAITTNTYRVQGDEKIRVTLNAISGIDFILWDTYTSN
jgi:hypothetical protein